MTINYTEGFKTLSTRHYLFDYILFWNQKMTMKTSINTTSDAIENNYKHNLQTQYTTFQQQKLPNFHSSSIMMPTSSSSGTLLARRSNMFSRRLIYEIICCLIRDKYITTHPNNSYEIKWFLEWVVTAFLKSYNCLESIRHIKMILTGKVRKVSIKDRRVCLTMIKWKKIWTSRLANSRLNKLDKLSTSIFLVIYLVLNINAQPDGLHYTHG